MAVITIKPKDVIVPFDLTVVLRKFDDAELKRLNEALKKKEKEKKT